MNWHTMSIDDVLKELKTDKKNGLYTKDAHTRLEANGPNSLSSAKRKSLFARFINQFSDFMVIVLLAAAAISVFTSFLDGNPDFSDSIVILLIVILNATLGVFQERRAEKAIDALKKLSSPQCTVIRDGKKVVVASDTVVVGDIIEVHAGDVICADARIITATNTEVEESALTGESTPVLKEPCVIDTALTPISERKNMLFSSTSVTQGHATAVCVACGMDTEVGKIATMITDENEQTPLQRKLAATGKILGIGAILICALIFLMGLIQGGDVLDTLMISISLAVAAIPEGLPAIVTIVLALGVGRMAKRRAIVKNLPSVETLGGATVICSDKTGTLTKNEMSVVSISGLDGELQDEKRLFLLTLASLCNNATKETGSPTEKALISCAESNGLSPHLLSNGHPRTLEIPFDSTRKLMTTVHVLRSGGYRIITKGAPEMLIPLCTKYSDTGVHNMDLSSREKAIKVSSDMASDALRVLGVAYRDSAVFPKGDIESDLTFVGFCGIIDPPRDEAYEAVSTCRRAGIKTVMITGDHLLTAIAIARKLKIMTPNSKALTGSDIDAMDDKRLSEAVGTCNVFARVTPQHKVRIVKAFHRRGEIVAMTGDGINDAPALKAADIGCSMGMCGTDVARQASDMVLTDDNFATIVGAIEEGRGIFKNIRRATQFLLSSNIGEIVLVFSSFLMRLPSPLLAIQLLWVNLVTDSLPAIALGMEPVHRDIMNRPPSKQSGSLLGGGIMFSIFIDGLMIGMLALFSYTLGRFLFHDLRIARTITFCVLSMSQLFHAYSMRSSHSIFKIGIFKNSKLNLAFLIGILLQVSVVSVPFLNNIFNTSPLNSAQWLIVAIFSALPVVFGELQKYINRKKSV